MEKKVLVVEDDATTRFMMTEMLDEIGVDFDVSVDGQDCLERVTADPHNYALVLMDIHMPRVSGVEATAQIRAADTDPPRNINILAVTADAGWHNPDSARAAGFNGVLRKPVSYSRLEETLGRYLAS